MLRPRIIPALLVHQGGLVKTVQFKDPKYVGDPINAVKIFNEKETDELIVLDIDATVERREPDMKLIGRLAMECRMPLAYGGGIRSADQAARIIALGVEKICVSSAAIDAPQLVAEVAREVGSQSVVVVLDVRREAFGDYAVWTRNATTRSGRALTDAIAGAEAAGAGEIVVNAIDNDGMMGGYDLDLARTARRATRLPLTLLGGAGSLDDIGRLFSTCGVMGAAAGSLFVFKGARRAVLINYPSPAQKDEIIKAALAG